jgi:hypothetical protein
MPFLRWILVFRPAQSSEHGSTRYLERALLGAADFGPAAGPVGISGVGQGAANLQVLRGLAEGFQQLRPDGRSRDSGFQDDEVVAIGHPYDAAGEGVGSGHLQPAHPYQRHCVDRVSDMSQPCRKTLQTCLARPSQTKLFASLSVT